MSQCGTCLKANKKTFRRNVKEKWVNHAKVCPGLLLLREKSFLAPDKLSAEAQAFIMHVTAGGEKHRRNTCDAYVATYWVYKYKAVLRARLGCVSPMAIFILLAFSTLTTERKS